MLLCEVVTPTKLLYHGQASLVEVPSVDGRFGVLPGHCMLSCRMESGVVTVYTDEAQKEKLEFASFMGFAQVNEDKVTILSREGILRSEIDTAKVKADLEDIKAKMAALTPEEQDEMKNRANEVIRHTYVDDINWLETQLKVAEG